MQKIANFATRYEIRNIHQTVEIIYHTSMNTIIAVNTPQSIQLIRITSQSVHRVIQSAYISVFARRSEHVDAMQMLLYQR